MKKVVVVTPPDACHGFALSGVRQVELVVGQLAGQLPALLSDPAIGLVVLDERLITDGVRAWLRELERRWPGVIVILPAPAAVPLVEEDYVMHLIRRAIGYQVRLGA